MTTIPNEIASEVPQACAELAAAEAVILDYLKSGKIDPKGLGAARKESQARIAALERRLKKSP